MIESNDITQGQAIATPADATATVDPAVTTDAATAATIAKPPAKAAKPRRGARTSSVIAVVVLIAGLGIIAYPTFSDWWNSYHQTRAIATYVTAVEQTDPALIESMLVQAREYNEALAGNDGRFNMTDDEMETYKSILNPAGNGVMGYVQIEKIRVDYPIYHGMEEKVLQVAIGHLEGTSFPIGGPSTHAAISGHRGLPSAKLFTDLDRLVEGDTFTITVLNQTITYEVDQIRIVLPEDLTELAIEDGQDYCTLITCTPYGINTHRMLVRGHRIDNLLGFESITPDAIEIPRYVAVAAVGIPILFVFLIAMLVYYRTHPQVSKRQVMDDLREYVRNSDGSARSDGKE